MAKEGWFDHFTEQSSHYQYAALLVHARKMGTARRDMWINVGLALWNLVIPAIDMANGEGLTTLNIICLILGALCLVAAQFFYHMYKDYEMITDTIEAAPQPDRRSMETLKDAAKAYAALDECVLSVLEDHRIDRWEVDTLKGGSWVICKCGQVDLAESDHRTHQAVQVTEMIERHKDLVFDLPSAEDNATSSRDFGRGFAHAVRLMRETLDVGRFKTVEAPPP